MASSIMLGTFKFRNLYFYIIYYIKENDTLLYISRKKKPRQLKSILLYRSGNCDSAAFSKLCTFIEPAFVGIMLNAQALLFNIRSLQTQQEIGLNPKLKTLSKVKLKESNAAPRLL